MDLVADSAPAADDIIIVAKQGASSLQDHAGSAAIFDARELQSRHVQNLTDLSFAAPNIALDDIGTFRGVANFAIRGLGVNSSIPSIDPAVGLFVDNIYMGINAGSLYDALDLESVQILRGPQSVMFGRNTTGGAVLIRTADPTWEWQGHMRLNIEAPAAKGRGAPMATIRGMISGPLNDRLAIRLAGLQSHDGGYFRNEYDGKSFGKADNSSLRGTILWKPTDQLSITAKAEWMQSDGEGAAGHNNGLFTRDNFRLSINERGFHHAKSHQAMLRAEWDAGEGQFTSLSAWRDYDLRTRNDIDSSPETIFHSDTATRQEQWSQEIFYRRNSSSIDWLVGAYAFYQKQGYDEDRDLQGLGQPKNYGGGRQNHEVYALYGNADWHILPRLTISAGLRGSIEKKRATITYVRIREQCSAIAFTCPVTGERVAGENNGFTDQRVWRFISPKLGLAYRANDKLNLYASWQGGERSGGYNLRITQPDAFEEIARQVGSPAFQAERVKNLELGAKYQSPDQRFHLHAALFQTDVKDMQREVSVASPTSGLAQSVYNTADARLRGAELEAQFAITPQLRVHGHAGYIDAHYRRIYYDISGDGAIDAQDRALRLPRAPEWSWGAGAQFQHEAGGVQWVMRADFQHRSPYAYTDNNYGWIDAIDSLNASLSMDLGQPAMKISLYGRNLLDQVQFGGDTQLGFSGGPNSDGTDVAFDPRPAAGSFSPLMKGRNIGISIGMSF